MRTVFFDLDGTLLESKEHFPSVFSRVLRGLGLERSPAQVEAALTGCWPWYEAHVGRHRDTELEFWLRFNARVCAALGAAERAEEAGRVVTETFRTLDATRLYDDALPCLDALATAGHPLGVLTARPDARRVLEPFDVLHRFAVIVDAFGAGSAKQDARAFHYALDLAGIPGRQAVHVGDQYDRDVLPAQAAGIHAVLIDREGRVPDADCPRITGLDALPELLGSF